MSSSSVAKEVAKILSIIFAKDISPNEDFSKENEPLWDSLKHIELMMVIEEEMDVVFDEDVIPSLISLESITKEIERLS